jgi:hypothetical protein
MVNSNEFVVIGDISYPADMDDNPAYSKPLAVLNFKASDLVLGTLIFINGTIGVNYSGAGRPDTSDFLAFLTEADPWTDLTTHGIKLPLGAGTSSESFSLGIVLTVVDVSGTLKLTVLNGQAGTLLKNSGGTVTADDFGSADQTPIVEDSDQTLTLAHVTSDYAGATSGHFFSGLLSVKVVIPT